MLFSITTVYFTFLPVIDGGSHLPTTLPTSVIFLDFVFTTLVVVLVL
jgi:hypothetical protein